MTDIRECLDHGADSVQIDFTEGRLSLKLDPSAGLLDTFIALNNRVLDHFSPQERRRIGVHTCPGGDRLVDSANVDYAGLLPALFRLRAGLFMSNWRARKTREHVLQIIRERPSADQIVFVGDRSDRPSR